MGQGANPRMMGKRVVVSEKLTPAAPAIDLAETEIATGLLGTAIGETDMAAATIEGEIPTAVTGIVTKTVT